MLKLTIEEGLTGPLAHPPTRKALEELVDRAASLIDAAEGIKTIPGLACYHGGSHVAVHAGLANGFFGTTRWAIITEGEG